MAFTGYTIEEGLEPGMNGTFTQHGFIAFTTTGTTVELPCRLRKIKSYTLTPVGTPGADEVLSINETVTDGGEITNPGTLTVTRAAGTTSGLIVSYRLVGY